MAAPVGDSRVQQAHEVAQPGPQRGAACDHAGTAFAGHLYALCARTKERFSVSFDERTMRELARLLRQRQKIEAIKQIREQTRLGLKESKDIADDLESALKRT